MTMLKSRMKRLDQTRDQAAARLADIENSLLSLDDEDLLDIADIFRNQPMSLIGQIVLAEMQKRNISL
ncbi:hypothetical protein [Sphingomonas abaci]|uniref:Uncharacterized protein n=1 Tax=Sphingomonas abaci TaxID=237611 RepID=A0A7W7APU5_9SPHN|nr:hypothetical protein [Sphingomonas abaci]MBB4620009.1 hypothetical protein [Sphingomonas abaci]